MSQTINLTVQETSPVTLTAEQARIIEAISPTIDAERVTGGVQITVEDYRETPETVTVYDGQTGATGQTGAQGPAGADGVSPTISSESITGGHRLTITDAQGETTVDVMDGADGQNGSPGADGYSPTASVSKSGSTATITITDKAGTTTATVSDGTNGINGQDGAPGVGVPAGGTTGQVLAKKSGTDYDTEWQTPSGGGGGETETWRLIADVTTTEDVAQILRTVDGDGNTFTLKKIFAVVIIKRTETSGSSQIKLLTKSNQDIYGLSIQGCFDMSAPGSAGKQNNYSFYAEFLKGINRWTLTGFPTRGENRSDNYSASFSPSGGRWETPNNTNNDIMTAVNLMSVSGNSIGAGSILKIWGVDA